FVLVEHGELDRLGRELARERLERLRLDDRPGRDALARARLGAVDAHATRTEPALRLRARDARERGERLVDAAAALGLAHDEAARARPLLAHVPREKRRRWRGRSASPRGALPDR